MDAAGTSAGSRKTGRELLEREAEIAVLRGAYQEVADGAGRVAIVRGPSGIGKTSLLEDLATWVPRDALVLSARGGEFEREFPYGVMRQLIERPLHELAPARRAKVMGGPAAMASAIFDGGTYGSATDVRADIEHGMYWLIANLAAGRPLAVVVDDLHWADPASLGCLVYLARRIDRLPALLGVAIRSGESGRFVGALEAMVGTRHGVEIVPPPLSAAGSAAFLRQRATAPISDIVAGACHELAGGNPWFLAVLAEPASELRGDRVLEQLREAARPGLARIVLTRVGRLGDLPVEVARGMAILGDGCSVSDLAAVIRRDDESVIATLDKLAAADVASRSSPTDFSHPILRTAVHADMTEALRQLLHARAAAVLRDRGAGEDDIARHLALSPRPYDASATEILYAAGLRQLAAGDPAGAVTHLRRAVEGLTTAPSRAAILLALGRAELRINDAKSAADHLRMALNSAQEDLALRSAIATELASALAAADDIDAAMRVLDAEIPRHDGDRATRLELERASLAMDVASLAPDARRRLLSMADRSPESMMDRLLLGNAALASAHDQGARAVDVRALAHRAVALEIPLSGSSDAIGLGLALYALALCEDHATVDAEIPVLQAFGSERGSYLELLAAHFLASLVALERGDLLAAATEGDAAERLSRILGESPFVLRCRGLATCSAVQALLLQGDHLGARALIERCADSGDFARSETIWSRGARGLMRLADHDAVGALEDLTAFGEIAHSAGFEDRGTPWRSWASTAHAALGQTGSALELSDLQVRIARAWGAPIKLGSALRARARVGSAAEAAGLLEQSVALLDASSAPVELAAALIDLGTVYRATNRRVDARRAFARGMDLAAERGARSLAARAREELRRLGARPRRLRISGVDSLTATERRTAELAAGGKTNREIASELWITNKTVESHLGRAFKKLDVSRRAELSAALHVEARVTG